MDDHTPATDLNYNVRAGTTNAAKFFRLTTPWVGGAKPLNL